MNTHTSRVILDKNRKMRPILGVLCGVAPYFCFGFGSHWYIDWFAVLKIDSFPEEISPCLNKELFDWAKDRRTIPIFRRVGRNHTLCQANGVDFGNLKKKLDQKTILSQCAHFWCAPMLLLSFIFDPPRIMSGARTNRNRHNFATFR